MTEERRPGARLAGVARGPRFVWAFVASLWVALVTPSPPADPDLFARVAVGRLIEVEGTVVDRDPFAFSPLRERWIDHEWLSGVVFHALARLGGDAALLLFSLATLVVVAGLLVRAQHERAGVSLGWSVVTLLHLFGVWISVVRSRIFTFLFVSLLLLALVRWREGRTRWIWLLPPCFLVWANAHGGFVAGLGLLGAAAVGVTFRSPRDALRLWLCLAACVAVTFVNPYGVEYWPYILEATTMERELISEWQPLRPWQIGLAVLATGIFLAGAWLERKRRRVEPEVWAMLAVCAVAAADAQRLVNFLFAVLAVYGAGEYRAVLGRVAAVLTARSRDAVGRVAAGVAFVAVAGLLAVASVQTARALRGGLSYARYPAGAVEWLDRYGAGGRLLTHFNHGSFALWRLYPRYRVAIDGRYEETYREGTLRLAWRALQPFAEGHDEALGRLDPDYILVPGGIEWAEDFGDGWAVLYRDDASVVLGRPELPVRDEPRPARSMWEAGF